MKVQLTEDQAAFVQQGIESGRFRCGEDAVRQALALWERYERRRAELLLSINAAESSLAAGRGKQISSRAELCRLAQEIQSHGRRRLERGREG